MVPTLKYDAIVIGASAGGLGVLSLLFEPLPENYPVPIILVQHRAKDPKDLLEQVLGYRCKVKIKQADEKEKIQGSIIYVAPPGYHLLMERNYTFSLSSDEQSFMGRPSIDLFFETASDAFKDRMVGIILTGANSDGAKGIETVRRSGGLTIAQDPAEAQFSMMPQSAIERGGVQEIWKSDRIRDFLVSLIAPNHEKD